MSDINKVLSCFNGVKNRGNEKYQACCPCHVDNKASLSIEYNKTTDKVLLHCQAGCDTADILTAVNLTWSDLNPEKENVTNNNLYWWQNNLDAKYDYYDCNGVYLYSKLRYKDKRFSFARISGGDFIKGKGKGNSTLYNLPETLKQLKKGKTIFYCEGEKDCNTLKQYGIVATTAGSVSDWRKEYSDYFIGADLVLLPDNDKPGYDLVKQIVNDCKDLCYRIRIVKTADNEHGDITDYFETGNSKNDLFGLVQNSEIIYPCWIYESNTGKLKINADLLADVILERNNIIVARNPGINTDLIYWYCNGVYKQYTDSEVIARITPYIPKGYASPALLKNVALLIRHHARVVDFDDINVNENIINLNNGIFNIDNMTLQEHYPGALTTIQLSCNYNEKATCKKWLEFIDDIARDDNEYIDVEMIDLLQEWCGVVLSSIFGYRIKKALVLYSPQGNTGKTVFLNVLTNLLGVRNISNVSFQDLGGSRWATGRAFGKRLLAIGDQGADSISSSSVFKELTGGDLVSAEFKGLQGFDYRYNGVIIAACNALPVFEDDKGNHISERLTFLDFRNVIPYEKRDPRLTDKLLLERDGIFQWCLKGLKRFLANGWHFSSCRSSQALMTEYRKRYDTLYSFITDELEYTGEQADYIRKTDFENDYLLYCQKVNFTPLAKRNIKPRAKGLGLKCSMLHGVEVYRGVKYRSNFNVSKGLSWIDNG